MLLRYLYDPNLAQASYLVGCQATGEALVVDPNRDIEQYLDAAQREGLRIVAVTETHIHADFVSGAHELAEQMGATLFLSDAGNATWQYRFPHTGLRDQGEFWVGNLRLQVLHTPGHTPEHLAFLLTDTAGADEAMGLFTGDCVFVGDIGRPDLLETAAGVSDSKEPAARALFATLQRLKELPDFLQLWPGHGAGSACGKALGAVPSTTMGYERRFNWAFRVENEDDFVAQVLAGQPEPPRYFAHMKRINRDGPPPRAAAPEPEWLDVEGLQEALDRGVPVVDTRPAADFAAGFLPGTFSIPFNSSFATWAGTLLSYDEPLALLVEPAQADDARRELLRIGLDQAVSMAPLDLLARWPGGLQPAKQMSVAEFHDHLAARDVQALDVRRSSEYAEGHIAHVPNLPLQTLADHLDEVPQGKPLAIHCQSGVRSAIAASFLRSKGFKDVANVTGGFAAWQRAGLGVEKDEG